MAFTPIDRTLLQRCLQRDRGAWNDFVDRFLGLIYHVIHSTAHLRSVPLQPADVEDLAAEVLLQIVADDYAVLRGFRKEASLATYLTVVARRIVVHALNTRAGRRDGAAGVDSAPEINLPAPQPRGVTGIDALEEVQALLKRLPAKEREVVRLFYLEGRTYEEISTTLGLPVNSIGPVLARAKKKLRGRASSAG